MVLLDTNILSEIIRPAPAPAVLHWLATQPVASVFIAVTEAELRYGVALLPSGKRRAALAAEIAAMLEVDFAGRILPFDSPAAVAYATLAADRARPAGRFRSLTLRLPPSPAHVGRSWRHATCRTLKDVGLRSSTRGAWQRGDESCIRRVFVLQNSHGSARNHRSVA
jgi:toxin FitB